jgi:hypothetical protein
MRAPFLDLGPLLREATLLQAQVEHYDSWGVSEAAHLLTSVQQVRALLRSVEFSAEVLVARAERELHGPGRGLRQDAMVERLGGRPGDAA